MANGTDIEVFNVSVKKQFRHAEWNHINSVIQEGLDNKNSKPFWKYVKSKKQDNIGVSPLKQKGNLISDSKGKADIFTLVNVKAPVVATTNWWWLISALVVA